MALTDLKKLKEMGMKMLSIASLIEYRHKGKSNSRIFCSEFSHNLGKFRLHTFRSILDERIRYVLNFGKWTKNKTPDSSSTVNVVSDVWIFFEGGRQFS